MTINCKGQLIDLSTPKIMGILNATPDSFFDGGKYGDTVALLRQAEKMLTEGADFIDLGGYSSKPGAAYVSQQDEISRLLPIINAVQREFPQTLISIDTFRSNVAKACVENGAAIINDISAGNIDPQMFETVACLGVPYIMMHMRGTPETMQQLTDYTDIIKEILFYFSEKVGKAREAGINDILIDPGFGFAKTLEQNYELLRNLELFGMLELPVLIGISRKSMIYKALGTTSENALNGTTALNMLALTKGAKILRVHDVKEAAECVKLYGAIINN